MLKKYEIPLLKDHHTHTSIYASLSNCIDLSAVRDKKKALSLMKKSTDEITVILGWNSSFFYFEDEELACLPPVVICNISFHDFLINRPARERLFDSHPDIISHIGDGDWVERNLYAILKFVGNIKPCNDDQVRSFFDEYLLKNGIWYAEDMLLADREFVNIFQRIGYSERTRFWADIETFDSLDSEAKKYVHGIKIFIDGALGAKTAAIKESFLTGERGLLIYSDEKLFNTLTQLSKLKKPVAIHAVGDLATDQIIKILSDIQKTEGGIPQIRIEHVQFISKESAENAKSLGIVLSMQPNFNNDSIQYADRLSAKYCKCNNPFRMLIDQVGYVPGEDLIFGSDGMPHGVQCALEQSLFPRYADQALTLEEFIAGYCMPDQKNGYIKIEIDEAEKNIKTEIVSN
ncbi:MAG TPA: amidohydrolase family protein [Desulfobacterales bacterium]|nr:amidohydrolase family protein [Desulfobacterales bacterium]